MYRGSRRYRSPLCTHNSWRVLLGNPRVCPSSLSARHSMLALRRLSKQHQRLLLQHKPHRTVANNELFLKSSSNSRQYLMPVPSSRSI